MSMPAEAGHQDDALTDVILNAVKDPTAFSNNQQLLLWMGFFPARRGGPSG